MGTKKAKPSDVGAFPVRQDITVLPADDPAKLKLGWKIYESIGSPIRRIINGEGLTPEQKYFDNKWPRDQEDNPIHHAKIDSEDGIAEGDEVLVKDIFDYHYEPTTITKRDGKFYAENECRLNALEFRKNIDHPDFPDEKPVWISTCCINKACLDILNTGEDDGISS